ncbi:beta-lactamase family protein [Rhodocaloribacter litoris]|uniref:serine hydrolase domain-containing protein n=1 Tax=Rhodocaloribacter litoris TaxID=2558931 RepID=UPI001420EB28|nr:serine hydrolase [Rhodocaloribacter litoris]QXD14981.1 beta-lactamase family protein [Rhodocaloribacter litoris]
MIHGYRGRWLGALLFFPLLVHPGLAQDVTYFPGPGDDWERRPPEAVGMDPARVDSAVAFALAGESPDPRDLAEMIALSFAREPYNDIIGPTKPRGGPAGLILRHGYLVAEWGDTRRVDMTFSVTKSFLSTVVGLAFDRGLIRRLDDPVRAYVPTGHFDSPHNAKITWDHLLRQTSAWEGTLWGKPDWADRPVGDDPNAWPHRPLPEPGTVWKYNDVRVNVLALAVLHVWRRPLPVVLRELVMDPIGASNTWRWEGYENSWVTLDGLRVQSVSGGGHWGGGMFISARDMARFGYLTLRRGRWGEQIIFSERWYDLATTPTGPNPGYGFMNWFLNTDRQLLPSAPETAFAHLGAGTNMVYVDPEHDLVVVARWLRRDRLDGLVQRVLAAVQE